jgi:predicted RNA-binding Zn-ribbon protein involved in translation (DUF1610 family)
MKRPKTIEVITCNDCNSKITNWSHECGGTVFDCPDCGCTNRDSVTIERLEEEVWDDNPKD